MAVDVYISEEKIKSRLDELAHRINQDYEGKELFVIGVLNGAFMFTADLIRRIKVPVHLDFMVAKSYGEGTESSGQLKIELDIKKNIANKDVLIVEDIVDTGLTMNEVKRNLLSRLPASLKLASLLYKPARNIHKVDIDYLAFEIEDRFVIGYGLDYAGKYRELPYIGIYSHD